MADTLDEVGLAELIERVATGENSMADIRSAARIAVRYDADFEGALDLLAGGASNGELGQIYRAAENLGVDPAVVIGYEEMGVRAAELEQAARVAERLGTGWASVLEAHEAGESWGSIRKGDEGTAQGQGNGQGNGQGQDAGPKGSEIQDEVNLRVAKQLAAKYGLTVEQVLSIFNSTTCGQDWSCVRTALREQAGEHGRGKDKSAGWAASLAYTGGCREAASWCGSQLPWEHKRHHSGPANAQCRTPGPLQPGRRS